MLSRLRRLGTALRGPARLPVGLTATAVCLAVAALYATALLPSVPGDTGPVQTTILRWAHPAVWVVLGGVCLAYALRADHVIRDRAAMTALGLFLVFVLVFTFA